MLWFDEYFSAVTADPYLNFVCVMLKILEKVEQQACGEQLPSLSVISVDYLQVPLVQPELWDEHYILQVPLGPANRLLQNRLIPSIESLDQISDNVGHEEDIPCSWNKLFLRNAGSNRRVWVLIRLTPVGELL